MTELNPYRELPIPEGPPDPAYMAAWRRYRRLSVLSSPVVVVPGLILTPIIHRLLGDYGYAGVTAMIFFVLWFYICVTAHRRRLAFQCPRCLGRFRSFDAKELDWCAHCKLPRFALSDPDAKIELR